LPQIGFRFRGQKTRAPNYIFQLGISDSSQQNADIIYTAPTVNRFLFFSLASFVVKRWTKYQEQKNTQGFFQIILAVFSPCKIRCFLNSMDPEEKQLAVPVIANPVLNCRFQQSREFGFSLFILLSR
jgi:hypothetical protein